MVGSAICQIFQEKIFSEKFPGKDQGVGENPIFSPISCHSSFTLGSAERSAARCIALLTDHKLTPQVKTYSPRKVAASSLHSNG